MLKYDRVLLGATKNNTLVFADIEWKDYFSVSFSEVEPIAVDDDYLRERIRDLVEYGLSDEVVLEMLKNYDCKPSELVDELFARCDIEGIIDISLYPESFDGIVKGETIYFEGIACGQLDTREYLIPIDKKFTDWLFDMWNKYRLKEDYPKEQIVCAVEDYLHLLGDERQWIENWLRSLYLSKKEEGDSNDDTV